MGLTVVAAGRCLRRSSIWGESLLLGCLLCSCRIQILKQCLSRQNRSRPAQQGVWCQSQS